MPVVFTPVKNASTEFNVPEELIFAIIKTESNFKSDAVSSAGAIGLMQLIPETFVWVSNHLGEEVTDDMISNPDKNIRYGTYFLRFLNESFEKDGVVYAAYNAGYSRVKGWLSDTRYSTDGTTLSYIPYTETANYVKAVSKARTEYEKILSEKINLSE
jgi:soluble lytic murein transglycosylase